MSIVSSPRKRYLDVDDEPEDRARSKSPRSECSLPFSSIKYKASVDSLSSIAMSVTSPLCTNTNIAPAIRQTINEIVHELKLNKRAEDAKSIVANASRRRGRQRPVTIRYNDQSSSEDESDITSGSAQGTQFLKPAPIPHLENARRLLNSITMPAFRTHNQFVKFRAGKPLSDGYATVMRSYLAVADALAANPVGIPAAVDLLLFLSDPKMWHWVDRDQLSAIDANSSIVDYGCGFANANRRYTIDPIVRALHLEYDNLLSALLERRMGSPYQVYELTMQWVLFRNPTLSAADQKPHPWIETNYRTIRDCWNAYDGEYFPACTRLLRRAMAQRTQAEAMKGSGSNPSDSGDEEDSDGDGVMRDWWENGSIGESFDGEESDRYEMDYECRAWDSDESGWWCNN